jgi:hypothetical protein
MGVGEKYRCIDSDSVEGQMEIVFVGIKSW